MKKKNLTSRYKRRRAKKYKRNPRQKKNSEAHVPRAPSAAALPSPTDVVSCFNFLKRSCDATSTTAAKRFKAAEDELDYDRILLPNKEKKDAKLFLTKEQIDDMFQTIQIAANKRYRLIYLSADQIISDDRQFPSFEDTDIIIVPIPLELCGQINLAVFNLLTSTVWLFCRYYRQSLNSFKKIKNILEQNYEINFKLERKNVCDMLINTCPNSYNDVILVFRTAEEMFFTGSVKKFIKLDLDAERKRYSKIYDMIHSDDWDGIWPPTLQSEGGEIFDPEENESVITRNGTSAATSESEIQLIEPNVYDDERTSSVLQNTFNEQHSTISDFYDFDDIQSPRSSIPNLSVFDHISSDTTQSSSSLISNSNNVVNNQLNASAYPRNRPLVSYSRSTTSSLTSSSYHVGSGFGSDVSYESSITSPQPTLAKLDLNGLFVVRDWRRSLTPQLEYKYDGEISSLSSGESSSESEDDEEINVNLPLQTYDETNFSDDENDPNPLLTSAFKEKCLSIAINFKRYWGTVRKLAEDRQNIIKKLKKQLSKSIKFKTDDEVNHINAKIDLIEHDINSYIPVLPLWKATYQKDTDKRIIIRKGYIYERIGETNEFKCVYKKNYVFEHCSSFIVIDNCDYLIEGSFCFHHHPPADNEKYTDDEPIEAKSILFPRVTKKGEKLGKYSKIINLLNELLNEVVQWRGFAILCLKNLQLIQEFLHDLETADNLYISSSKRNPSKIVVVETKNLLNCIRLDKS